MEPPFGAEHTLPAAVAGFAALLSWMAFAGSASRAASELSEAARYGRCGDLQGWCRDASPLIEAARGFLLALPGNPALYGYCFSAHCIAPLSPPLRDPICAVLIDQAFPACDVSLRPPGDTERLWPPRAYRGAYAISPLLPAGSAGDRGIAALNLRLSTRSDQLFPSPTDMATFFRRVAATPPCGQLSHMSNHEACYLRLVELFLQFFNAVSMSREDNSVIVWPSGTWISGAYPAGVLCARGAMSGTPRHVLGIAGQDISASSAHRPTPGGDPVSGSMAFHASIDARVRGPLGSGSASGLPSGSLAADPPRNLGTWGPLPGATRVSGATTWGPGGATALAPPGPPLSAQSDTSEGTRSDAAARQALESPRAASGDPDAGRRWVDDPSRGVRRPGRRATGSLAPNAPGDLACLNCPSDEQRSMRRGVFNVPLVAACGPPLPSATYASRRAAPYHGFSWRLSQGLSVRDLAGGRNDEAGPAPLRAPAASDSDPGRPSPSGDATILAPAQGPSS